MYVCRERRRNVFVLQEILIFLLLGTNAGNPEVLPKRPHIVFFLADDLGWNDVSFHGFKQIPTPNVDALAKDGIVLHQHYVQPLCSPSRAALMTGKYPIRLGFQDYVIRSPTPFGLPLTEKILPQYLQALNYATHAVGKWHLGFFKKEYLPMQRGFDSFFGYYVGVTDYFTHENHDTYAGLDLHDNYEVAFNYSDIYGADLFTQKAKDIILKHNPSKPLFLYVSQQAPHSGLSEEYPLQTTGKYFRPLTSIKDFQRRIYGGMVSAMDESVAEVFAALEQSGMLDDTIFVFTSDNGGGTEATDGSRSSNYPLRGAKFSLRDGGVRSASFIWSPMLRSVSRVYHELMHITDWLPTLLAAAGSKDALSELCDIDGVNHWPSFISSSPAPRSEVLLNINPVEGTEAYRSGRFKLIKGKAQRFDVDGFYGREGKPMPIGDDSTPSLAELRSYEEVYTKFMKRSKVVQILRKKYQKNLAELLHCDSPPSRDLTVDCNLPRPSTDNCDIEGEACLYDVIDDPCELYNIAELRPEIVTKLQQRIDRYKSVMVPPFVNFVDPASNPKFHGNAWIPWLSVTNVTNIGQESTT